MTKQHKTNKDSEKAEVKEIKDLEEEIVVEQEKEILDMAKKAEEYLNGWKRTQADFENYKKMQAESLKDMMRYAGQNMILQIIPVLDNFHMSTDHIPEDQKGGGWVTGIMHIQKQLENVLAENGVEEIPAKVGDTFDPAMHEAVSDSNDSNPHPNDSNVQKIKRVLLKGYKMDKRIIRPTRVVVE